MKTQTTFLVGGVLGAAVMLLLAPRSGEETRVKILGKVSELRGHPTETIKDKASQARSKANELKENVETKAVELHY
jgi:gas vesicle protein